ncbi:glucose-6-phosphate exchanger SLC37A2-like [Symsagittifera roscoffensis]|uniref:glucose-6-phosphate exchanger SLC37A2-like n=1 Tax=Symsagittifera roscoffensis TaxID=84072 RepID=UPI00307B2E82
MVLHKSKSANNVELYRDVEHQEQVRISDDCSECERQLQKSDSVINLVIIKDNGQRGKKGKTRQVGIGAHFLAKYILPRRSCSFAFRNACFKCFTIALTYATYCCFHLSRKPISVVKTVLHSDDDSPKTAVDSKGWAPFDAPNGQTLFSCLDSVYLFSYAFGMFVSGHLAERYDLRLFLCLGTTLSAIFTAAFGLGFYLNLHIYWFYFMVQMVGGFFQSSGWPAVVTCLGNWCGKKNRGFVMGVWNSHTPVGNILGSIIAGYWVESQWGLSFIVPGLILGVAAVVNFLFLIPFPEYVGCNDPVDKGKEENYEEKKRGRSNGLTKKVMFDDTYKEQTEQFIPKCEHHLASFDISPRNDSIIGSSINSNSSSNGVGVASSPPVSFGEALRIPGVVTYSMCLFFTKLVSYTFLFWLPLYIQHSEHSTPQQSANMSTLFDFGGILGCIVAGVVTDYAGERCSVCAAMLGWAAPALYLYLHFGAQYATPLLFICGVLVNGPYGLITTAVAADLGTHPSIGSSSRALATVTSIIDGTGSVGAALGPLMAGVVSSYISWPAVLYVLILADLLALLFLTKKSLIKCILYPLHAAKLVS